ncbi:uncharacterized protein EKO05_0010438 [Ascochyta rabiei]|uniref:Uncharacterized protein n=1 Tax=Didymella rabiei TaxID=5454 RepID=A0A163FIH4_DIDRA|nr:uncharacterized protein EKO05_0010438 [Ascochyta rabiei]KZM24388.1 hypothetical protein ST47_g4468 [Ascochyta rabiei]UPX20198.1 hypothetical protein EKO05_0010438 [Ascochyta rabiei]
MALKYALAALAFGAAFVNGQSTEDSVYTVSDDYYNYGRTSRYSSKTSLFWTATVKYQDWVSTSTYTRLSGQTTTYLDTYTRTIKPTVMPTATPTYTSTYSSRYEDVLVVELYYPENAVAESDFVPTSTWESYVSSTASASVTYSTTAYFMPVTMTAPSSCPTIFTVATQASITYIPTVVADQLQPTSTDVSTSTFRSYVAEYSSWYLTAGAAPFTSTDDYYYSYYIASCTPPPAQYTSGTGSSGGGGSSSGSDGDDSWTDYRTCYFGGCTSLKTWIIIIATVLPGIFLLGFLESWFWYTRLMKGKSALRCGTVCWVLLSLWVLCFTRMQDARSKEDQKLLQQKWKEMPAGQKFKNWSWGFKRRYPVLLLGQYSKQTVGIVPEGQPLHPAMVQAAPGQVFYYGPLPPGPPGFQQPPHGGVPGYPMPAQGYPQQAGYYAAYVPKEGVVVGSSPVAGTATPPQALQPVYHPPNSPPPNAQLPPQPQQAAPAPAPALAPVPTPPANVSEAPAPQPASAPAPPATTQPAPTHAAPAKNDADDLYE